MTKTEQAEARKARIAAARAERRGMGSVEIAMMREAVKRPGKPRPIFRKLTIAEHMDRAVHTNTVRKVS